MRVKLLGGCSGCGSTEIVSYLENCESNQADWDNLRRKWGLSQN